MALKSDVVRVVPAKAALVVVQAAIDAEIAVGRNLTDHLLDLVEIKEDIINYQCKHGVNSPYVLNTEFLLNLSYGLSD